jgi:hypothetical protein
MDPKAFRTFLAIVVANIAGAIAAARETGCGTGLVESFALARYYLTGRTFPQVLRAMFPFHNALGVRGIALSRETCVYASAFCRAFCYDAKYERGKYERNTVPAWRRNVALWIAIASSGQAPAFAAALRHTIDTARDPARRARKVRLGVAGELFAPNLAPHTLTWIRALVGAGLSVTVPSRAWRDPSALPALRAARDAGASVMLSSDPEMLADPDLAARYAALRAEGFGGMHFGSDVADHGLTAAPCPKTWTGRKGACARCALCYGAATRKGATVYLRQHR